MRRTQDGHPVAALSLATSEWWRDKATGERNDKDKLFDPRIVTRNQSLSDVPT
jgi:single-stranded DNA-binding protein